MKKLFTFNLIPQVLGCLQLINCRKFQDLRKFLKFYFLFIAVFLFQFKAIAIENELTKFKSTDNNYNNIIDPNFTVTSLSDDGSNGTLRWAILQANGDASINQIVFDPSLTGTITLTADLPNISRSLTISGSGTSFVSISGNDTYKMFIVNTSVTLTISGLTFTKCGSSAYQAGSMFYANRSTIIADDILVTGNTRSTPFYSKEGGSLISITNSTFSNNSSTLFGSDYGNTPSTTGPDTDYGNRIMVSGSTFSGNTGTIFSTERFVKIDDCTFTGNSSQIGAFRGLNRFQVLNSTFLNNTGWTLFSFGSALSGGWGVTTLGDNHHLFDSNVFSGNTGTVINTGSANEQLKTTISNNTFTNNGNNWTGTPKVVFGNLLDNFITSVSHDLVNGTITVNMSKPVFGETNSTGSLDINDFELSLTGGNATLSSMTPTSLLVNGNSYTLGIQLTGFTSGEEVLTVSPVTNSIYDEGNNIAYTIQKNSSVSLQFFDEDNDGVADFMDQCPNTPSSSFVDLTTGCPDPNFGIIWDGSYKTITKLDGADFRLPANQDSITIDVIITRGNNQGLFNIASESNFSWSGSPAGTLWARVDSDGLSTNEIRSLNFQMWGDAFQWCPPCQINNYFLVYLPTEKIYFYVKLLSWSSGSLGGFSYQRSTFPNVAPSDIDLDHTAIDENAAIGTIIGILSSTDEDLDDIHSYSLVSGSGDTDNASFTISGDELMINEIPNFASQSSYTIRIRTTDAAGGFFEKSFTISVNDITDPTISLPGDTSKEADQDACYYTVQGTEFDPISVTDNSGTISSLTYLIEKKKLDCSFEEISNGTNSVAGENLPVGENRIIWTASDPAGNESSEIISITVSDTQKPVFVASSDVTETTALGAKTKELIIADIVVSDNCSIEFLTWEMTGATIDSGTDQIGTYTFNTGLTTIVHTATDVAGNSETSSFTVSLKEAQEITFGALDDKSLEDADFTLSAISSAGLTISYSSSDPAIASVSGNIVSINGLGAVTITASQIGNAAFDAAIPVEQSFEVIKIAQVITFPEISSKTYGDGSFVLGDTQTDKGLSVSYTAADPSIVSISGNEATILTAGTTTITATQEGDDNHFAATAIVRNLTVNKAALTITATDKTKVYGEENPALTFTYTGLVNGDTKVTTEPSIATTATASSNVGTYPITLTGAADANYDITLVAGELEIAKAGVTITATDKSKVYGEANPTLTFTYTGLVNGDTQVETEPSIATTATASSNVGTYPITLTGAADANYDITLKAGELEVTKATLTIIATNKTKVYGEANPTLTFTYTGLVNEDEKAATEPSISTTATASSNVGTYPITLTGAADANYDITLNAGELEVTKATLTITATNKTKVYGEANPALTFTYTGLVNGDTKVTTEPSIATTATASSNVGTYPITLTGAADANYDITLVAGELEVTKATLTIIANEGQSKIYGTADPIFNYSATGFAAGDDEQLLTGNLTRDTGEAVGNYPINLGNVSAGGNYQIVFTSADFEIIPAVIEAVMQPAPIETIWGVYPELPSTVTVMTTDGQFLALPITWDLQTLYVFGNGEYPLSVTITLPTGILNTEALTVEIVVTVLPKPAPEDILLDNNSFEAKAGQNFIAIGNLKVVDPIDNQHEISLADLAFDNVYFQINNGTLFWNSAEKADGRTEFRILVRVVDRDGNILEKEFTIIRNRTSVSNIEIFNSFTPNGDNVNDTWGVEELRFYKGVRIQVFERSGKRIFYTEDPDMRWDGTFNSGDMPTGTYYWTVEVGETGEVRKGMLNLIRK